LFDPRYPNANILHNKDSLEQIDIMDKLGDKQIIMSQIPEFVEIFNKILKKCKNLYFIVTNEENRKSFSKNIFLKDMLITAHKPIEFLKLQETKKDKIPNQMHQNILANAVLKHLIYNKHLDTLQNAK